jgi:hypothetical protein
MDRSPHRISISSERKSGPIVAAAGYARLKFSNATDRLGVRKISRPATNFPRLAKNFAPREQTV